jgi:hypothetical protein
METRRPLRLLATLTVTLALAGCGDDSDTNTNGDGGGTSPTSTTAATSGTGTADATSSAATTTTPPAACGADPPSNPVAPQPCTNPQPGPLAGWISCDEGTRHRDAAVACDNPTDCTTDADCGDDAICDCAGNASTCVTAYCTSDADCLDGYHCWRWNGAVSCDGPFDRCRVEPCLSDGTTCENCEYDPTICAMTCVDYGPCTG